MSRMNAAWCFTPEQKQAAGALCATFQGVAARHGWQRTYSPSLAQRCVVYGLETLPRFTLTTLAVFHRNVEVAHSTSRLASQAVEDEKLWFASEADRAKNTSGWSPYMYDKFWPLTDAISAAAETRLQKQHANRLAMFAVERGLEDLDRIAAVQEQFFRFVMHIKSDEMMSLVKDALSTRSLTFRPEPN